MGYLFIDIETYVDKISPLSGLNPYLKTSKIISIAYNYYNQLILKDLDIKKPTLLKEWESSEREILLNFYRFLKMKVEDDKHIKLVGFNHLKFDLTYLFGRFIMNEVADPEEIYTLLYKKPHCIDLAQISQIISNHKSKEIMNVGQKVVNRFFGIPVRSGSGLDYTKYYENKEYDKYEKTVYDEFSFEKLYINLREHLQEKKTMLTPSKRKVQTSLFDSIPKDNKEK